MNEKEEIIVPEVLDEQGNIIQANEPPAWNDPHDHARPQGDTGGILGGFLTVAAGLIVTACILLFSLFILLPLALIGRIFGFHVRTFKH